MGAKSLKFTLKNDRVEKVENAMLGMARVFTQQIAQLNAGIEDIQGEAELIYEELMSRTLRGRWARFKKWLRK